MSRGSLKKVLLGTIGGFLLILIGSGIFFYFLILNDLPDISKIDNYRPSLGTKLYTIDGEQFAEFATEKRTLVGFSEIPEHLVQAVISVEDARFYQHNGLDWQGITRAFWENVRARKYVQGASTITQQLARALFLTPKKTLRRKAQEALLALEIDKRYPKEDIITLYLNQVYLGRGAYGVEAAARTYFDKSVSELDLRECSFIAGLPRAPSYYNPYHRPEVVEVRRLHVLKRMFDEHYINEAQFIEASKEPPVFRELVDKYNPAPYFSEHVRRILEDKYGSNSLYRDGLEVYTTLDLNLQKVAQKVLMKGVEELDRRQGWRPIENPDSFPAEFKKVKDGVPLEEGQRVLATVSEVQGKQLQVIVADKQGYIDQKGMAWAKIKKLEDKFNVGDKILARVLIVPQGEEIDYKFALDQYPIVQGAIIAINPKTGFIKAMVGGYCANSKFNRAVQAKRQPGSAFKPIIYVAGLKDGYNPASILLDAPIIYQDEGKEKEWKPVNYHEKFVGPTTLRDALEHSRNVVTIKMLKKIGIKKVIKTARDLGINSHLDPDLSLALGSSSISLLEMTSAYGVFANGGVVNEPRAIFAIADNNMNILEENVPKGKQVLDEKVSYLITRLLQGVVEHGTGWRGRSLGRPVAGKTGTTNNYIDAWFIGFSPQLAVGVWVGFDEPRTMGRIETGSRAASPIWVDFMREALKNLPPEDFKAPSGVVELIIDAKSGMLATNECTHVIKEYFSVDNVPTELCDKHRPQMQKFLEVDLAGGLDVLADITESQDESVLEGIIFD